MKQLSMHTKMNNSAEQFYYLAATIPSYASLSSALHNIQTGFHPCSAPFRHAFTMDFRCSDMER
jgi:hypothetical protein